MLQVSKFKMNPPPSLPPSLLLPPNPHIPVYSGDVSVALLCTTADWLMGKDNRRIM